MIPYILPYSSDWIAARAVEFYAGTTCDQLTAAQVRDLRGPSDWDKIVVALWLMPDPQPLVSQVVQAAVERHALHCGFQPAEKWAMRWLSGEECRAWADEDGFPPATSTEDEAWAAAWFAAGYSDSGSYNMAIRNVLHAELLSRGAEFIGPGQILAALCG